MILSTPLVPASTNSYYHQVSHLLHPRQPRHAHAINFSCSSCCCSSRQYQYLILVSSHLSIIFRFHITPYSSSLISHNSAPYSATQHHIAAQAIPHLHNQYRGFRLSALIATVYCELVLAPHQPPSFSNILVLPMRILAIIISTENSDFWHSLQLSMTVNWCCWAPATRPHHCQLPLVTENTRKGSHHNFLLPLRMEMVALIFFIGG